MNDKVDKIIKEVESIIAEYKDYEKQKDANVCLGWRECAYRLLDYIYNLNEKLNTEEVNDE